MEKSTLRAKIWPKSTPGPRGVAEVLMNLSETNWLLGFLKEGIERVEEALKIHERFGDVGDRHIARSTSLGRCKTTNSSTRSPPRERRTTTSSSIPSSSCRSKGETDKAIHLHCEPAQLFRKEGRFDDARARIENAKPRAVDNVYRLGHTIEGQARVWYGCRAL